MDEPPLELRQLAGDSSKADTVQAILTKLQYSIMLTLTEMFSKALKLVLLYPYHPFPLSKSAFFLKTPRIHHSQGVYVWPVVVLTLVNNTLALVLDISPTPPRPRMLTRQLDRGAASQPSTIENNQKIEPLLNINSLEKQLIA